MNNIETYKQKTKFWKIGNRYFLPLEIYDYINISLLFFYLYLFDIYSSGIKILSLIIFVCWFIAILIFIKDRFFIEIKTSNSEQENIKLIEELALRQENVGKSLEQQGLFVFDYEERNVFYKYNFRKRSNTETVVIFCENKSIFINSYNHRYFGIIKRYNLKQWIKLLKIKCNYN